MFFGHNKNKLINYLIAFGIIAIVIFVYRPAVKFDFINFDDNIFIVENPHINTGITLANIIWAFTETYAGQWQPITWLSHMLDVHFFGLNAGYHHLSSIIVHALSSALFYFLLTLLAVKRPYALLIALFWALHPMRLESVVWVAERKDVLSIFFAILAMIAYLKFYTKSGKYYFYYILLVLLFALSLMSKPIVISLPILLLLFDYLVLNRKVKFIKLLIEKAPLFLLSIISTIITILAQQKDQSLNSLDVVSISSRISMAACGYLAYFAKLVYPSAGGIFYPNISYAPGVGAGAVLALGLIFFLCKQNFKNEKCFMFAFLWIIISLLPVIGLVHIGGQSLADRWTYFSHFGLLVALAVYLNKNYSSDKWQKIIYIFLFLILFFFSTLTFLRLPNWKNSESIFKFTLEVSPNNFLAHTNLGSYYEKKNRIDLAEIHFEEAARLNPTYPEALNNLGILRANQGRYKEARVLFEKALNIRADFLAAKGNLQVLNSQEAFLNK